MKIEPRTFRHTDDEGRIVRIETLSPLVVVVCTKGHGPAVIARVFDLGAKGLAYIADVEGSGDEAMDFARERDGLTGPYVANGEPCDLGALDHAEGWCNTCRTWRAVPLMRVRSETAAAKRSGSPRVVRL